MSDSQRATRSKSGNDTERLRMEPGVDFINTLNDDCLAEVFTYLSIQDRLRVQAVCQRWRKNHQLVWGRLKTLGFDSRWIPQCLKNDKAISIILKRSGIFLRQITIGHLSNNSTLPMIVKHCPNLQRLEMSIGNENCTKWLSQMERLECLEITGHFFKNFFDTLSCVNLNTLELFSSMSPMGSLHSSIFERLPKLSNLTVSCFYLTEDVLMAIFCNPNLVSLSLVWCSMEGKFPSLNLINLEHLEIFSMDTITDSFLSQVSKICKNLRCLKLHRTWKVTDEGVIELGKLLKLEELLMSSLEITDMHFVFTCCLRVHDDGIITLMRNAPSLQFLNLMDSGVTERVLIEASEIVKKRSNDLELKILIRDHVKSQWAPADVSPLLVVKTNY